MKKWLRDLFTNILGNLLTPLAAGIIAILAAIVGIALWGLYIFFKDNFQTALLVALVVLVLIDTILNVLNNFKRTAALRLFHQTTMALVQEQQSLFQLLQQMGVSAQVPSAREQPKIDPRAIDLERKFVITDKHFDAASNPQKIVVVLTNRGQEIIRIKRVRFSGTREFSESALMSSYTTEDGHYYTIPHENTEILPNGQLPIELCLAQMWKPEQINPLAGKWGYFKIDVTHRNEEIELFYSI